MNILTDDNRTKIKQYAKERTYEETVGFATVICPDGSSDAALRLVDVIFKKATYKYTDWGNAQRLYDRYGDSFRWVVERKLFSVWNGKAWSYDTPDDKEIYKLAKLTVRYIPDEKWPNMTDKEFDALLKFASNSQNQNKLKASIESVKSECDVSVSITELNADPYLFNCRNATIDLRTGEGRPQSKDDLITVVAPVDYNPEAKCPKWLAFLNLIMANSQEKIKYLQTLVGYCMTADTKTDVIPFCHGYGGNGKSTFWQVIRDKIMGLDAYGYEVDPDVLVQANSKFGRDSGIREEIANLYGKRLVTAIELPDGELNTKKLKAMTGGEAQHGDRKYERGITYKPTYKIILSGNTEPTIKDPTDGTWRRVKKIPFTVKIPNPIDGFEETFNDELSGILNWMIEGSLRWQNEGLKDPKEVVDATDEYRATQDNMAIFITEKCEYVPGVKETQNDFYNALKAYWIENGIAFMQKKDVKARLLATGKITIGRGTGNVACYEGIRLLPKTEPKPEADQNYPDIPCPTCGASADGWQIDGNSGHFICPNGHVLLQQNS